MARVLGVDACRGGWVGVTLGDGATAPVCVARAFAGLLAGASTSGPFEVVGPAGGTAAALREDPGGAAAPPRAARRRRSLGRNARKGAAVDDVLDAAVVAWSSVRVASGVAESLPDPPEVFSDGWPTATWV